ncbi:hypothetical protein [Fimbriimonas ginsengisoli]|uniref:Organic solvent tolerance protein n=1 Tax=Fimbriimonas ginsengisoli Gsoil 348 TaxID=661478 RepID=A0A068NT38_FIMGI|nr:hypothetical protein [Fimbriimonas ginsengisoli]AIE86708.1 organic solvent tolerance protein [Fimbriimonas ginsengisoli Gsoil 348]
MPKGLARRSAGAVAFLACSACASAQMGGYDVLIRAGRQLQETNQIPRAPQPNPLEPVGNPGLPPKTPPDPTIAQQGDLPGTENPDEGFKLIRSGRQRWSGKHVEMDEGVEFVYKGYHVFADSGEGDLNTNIFSLAHHVQIIGTDAVVKGERVVVDFKQRTYRSFNAESQVSPKLVGGKILNDVYIKARESFGSQRETRSFDAEVTSCNLEHPHYSIDGEDVVVRPGIRAIFRRAKIRLFGRTILRVPYLSIPLDDRQYRNLPTVGQSPDEGYYIKTNYGIPLKGEKELRSRLDYMSKLGVGVGADYAYTAPRMGGFLRFYTIRGNVNTLSVSNEHRQNLGWGELNLTTDIQQGNYLSAPDSTLLTNRAVLTIPRGSDTTQFGFARTANSTFGNSTTTQTITLSDQRNVFGKVRTNVDLNWLTNKSEFQGQPGQKREQLEMLVKAQEDLPKGQASLEYQRSIPIGETGSFFSSNDRTPVITFSSDAQRLVNQKFAQQLPFRTEVSLGEFQDLTGNSHVSRGNFDFSFQKPDRSRKRFHLDYNGEFRQGIYSDDTAQYVLNYGTQMGYSLGRDTAINLRYNYLRPYGYSPLQQDRSGKTNLVTGDISYRPIRSFLIGAQSGYDINRIETSDTGWQQVGLRTEWIPTSYFLLRSLSTYDTFQGAWSSVRFDLGYQPGATLLTIGTRYDGIRKVWSNANIFLNNLKVGRARLSAALTYNGYTKQFDSKQYSMIYDLHCAEAVFTMTESNTGFRAGREIQFFVRLKAFPFNSLFGIGRRGQPLGTGTGRDF